MNFLKKIVLSLIVLGLFFTIQVYSFAEEVKEDAVVEKPPQEKKEEQEKKEDVLAINPFELEKERIVPGGIIRIKIDKELFKTEQDTIEKMVLTYQPSKNKPKKTIEIGGFSYKHMNGELYLLARMPDWEKIDKNKSVWKGFLHPCEADLNIIVSKKNKNKPDEFVFNAFIPVIFWAYFWGIFVILLIFIILTFIKKREGKDLFTRFITSPLNFAITPRNKYSISSAQIIFWTFVIFFGMIYVYRLSGTFLEITPQVLVLLGIGGATALASRINGNVKSYELPPKFSGLLEKTQGSKFREPKLRDLISSQGELNIYKFQMLVFTLLIGIIVIMYIIKDYSFPELPENLLYLMGLSGTVYIGHKLSEKESENLKNKQKAMEDALKGEKEPLNADKLKEKVEKIPEVKEFIDALKKSYTK